MDNKKFTRHIDLSRVKITDNFWRDKIELVRREVIPYQYLALSDKIEGAEKSYCIENFKKAIAVNKKIKAGQKVEKFPVDKWHYDESNSDINAFHGWVFQDSDVYKWIEAVDFQLTIKYDEELKAQADEYIELICEAQLENGYLDTLYIINDRDKVFTNLKDYHELYCFGHLAEAGVSFFNATGDRKLLDAACRFADLICSTFNEENIHGYPGHEICEMALVKLYDVTGEEKYLKTAEFFINERGKKPYYFDIERNTETDGKEYIYNQAHIEPRKQDEAVGHAVRGVYLYSGMADISKRLKDDELYLACKKIWRNIADKKMYITGGIGSTVHGEAFTYDYDLPNDLAYCETCASIGLIFFAQRMAEIEQKAEYFSVVERALYNTVLSGMANDGKSFFYVNALEVLPKASKFDERKKHIKPVRQKWFSCACCPPNLARLISSLGSYIYYENDEEIYVNLLISSKVKTDKADVEIQYNSSSGDVKIYVKAKKPFTLKVRNGEHGYTSYYINDEDTINLNIGQKPKLIKCSENVRENMGKVAVMKGNMVYCLEQADNGFDLHRLLISSNPEFEERDDYILANGFREKESEKGLYFEYKVPEYERIKLRFIPYYKWGNRGENEMTVYIRVKNE